MSQALPEGLDTTQLHTLARSWPWPTYQVRDAWIYAMSRMVELSDFVRLLDVVAATEGLGCDPSIEIKRLVPALRSSR